MGKVQWFVNAEYADGFWYVLREDGTASIVGADHAYFEGETIMQIPTELNGVTVTRIETRAFESLSKYLGDVSEIILSETVEEIGEAAFSMAMRRSDGSIKLVEGLKKSKSWRSMTAGSSLQTNGMSSKFRKAWSLSENVQSIIETTNMYPPTRMISMRIWSELKQQ